MNLYFLKVILNWPFQDDIPPSQTAAIREETEMSTPVEDASGNIEHVLNNILCVE